MKLSSPTLSPALQPATQNDILQGDLEDALLEDADISGEVITALDISGVKFERVLFTTAQCERVSAKDMVAKGCDFSATNVSNGGWNRTEFIACRMSGVDFNKASLRDVVFRGCKLDMANFRFADLRRVAFIDCELHEADFLSARLLEVVFENCRLNQAVFEQVHCNKVDLRTSDLTELKGWSSLKGAILDDAQLMAAAPYLATELGIRVE